MARHEARSNKMMVHLPMQTLLLLLSMYITGLGAWQAERHDPASLGRRNISATNATNDYWGVIRAAGNLALDFGLVTGTNYSLSNGVHGSAPASTRQQARRRSPGRVIDALVSSGWLNVSAVKGNWESFTSQLVKNPVQGCPEALVVAGSDPRGTIYGIYDVSEQIGVSPWYFWADVPPKKKPDIFVLPAAKVQNSPSVKFRGFFLNDEQPALTNWVASHWPDTPFGAGYGPAFYSLVFELLLRLRANYLWPAVWATMFEVDEPGNQPLADAYEIVLGSSHTEPLMRAQNEFGAFYQGPWAYNVNNKTIDDYFRYGVQRAKPYARNSLWTMGMRGTGDSAIEGLGTDAIVTMLQTVVKEQQSIISAGLGVNISTVPQMWCLYKEVQSYIFAGLQVPDDITLLWSDDNWGSIRRLPLVSETSRAGGAGVYYHFDYVGDPRDYKWINTIQLTKTAEQMHMAYSRGADRIWMVNVGDLKPLEIPINHFFDMAYDARRWGVDSTEEWAASWAAREFGSDLSGNIRDLMLTYGTYAARRKYELIEPETYSVINYREADTILEQWSTLADAAVGVYEQLGPAAQPAFFEMILHPILAGQIVHKIYIGAARNALYAGQQRSAANDVISQVLAASAEDANLTVTWDRVLDGKWKHMMDQTHLGYDGYWQQPMRNSLPAMTYVQVDFVSLAGQVGVGVEGSNASVQGDDQWHPNSGNHLALPPLDPYGPITRYFDVFSRGTQACDWRASAATTWVKLSQYTGTVGPGNGSDTRVYVSVDWASAPTAPNSTTVNISFHTACRGLDRYGYRVPTVQAPVVIRTVPSNFTQGFVESDGHVSIEGPHYQAIVPASTSSSSSSSSSSSTNATGPSTPTYHTFTNLGRTLAGVGLVPQNTEKLSVARAPALEYDLYLFTGAGTARVTVYLSLAHNYLGDADPLQYGIALYPADDPAAPQLVRPVGPLVGADLPPGWGQAVGDAVWGRSGNYTTSAFAVPRPGAYKLRVWALLPSMVVQKVVVDLGGVRPSYLGPPESFLVGRDGQGTYEGTTFAS
ncbi:hypothetical protein P8C59_005975 [Phyllachora maydis]|uniref:Gylcosyl hydrolase 115 C-terminal domain-containing protein n=1 Tax=Phyllachora maydis TaxID=1825666 RepID=A0AAD9I5W9_9PEZI|nr:hypothetical protein P8C59_005975 [Phyllachora maydis]